MMVSGTTQAFAAPTPSGDMNLSLDGYAVITPTSGTAETADIRGLGQVTADTIGAFSGALTYTGVRAASGTEHVCAGTVSGTITPPAGSFAAGDGNFTMGLSYTPSSSATGTDCIPSSATSSVRGPWRIRPWLTIDVGQDQCIATSVTAGTGASATIEAASLHMAISTSPADAQGWPLPMTRRAKAHAVRTECPSAGLVLRKNRRRSTSMVDQEPS
jgi:hypothetical protein